MGKTEDGKESEVRRRAKPKPKHKDSGDGKESRFKNYLFLALFLFPALATLISASGDFFANFRSVLGSVSKLLMVLAIVILPVLLGIFVKKFRGFLKIILPGIIVGLIFPTLQVYLCSPIALKNEDIGTGFSLKTTASEFLEQICQEECLEKSRIPSTYSLTMFTPRVAMKARFKHIIDLNVTTTAMVGGEQVKLAKLVLLRSWRSVKGKLHPLHLITRIPTKLKKFELSLQAKKDVILTGRIAEVTYDLRSLKSQLEKQRHFIRAFVLEVFRVLPLEDEQ